VDGEVVFDGALQLAGAAEGAAPDLLGGEGGEEAFDQVDPRSTGGSEAEMKARSLGEPGADQRRLVSTVVVGDEVDVEVGGDVAVDGVEELAKLRGSVTAVALPKTLPVATSRAAKSDVVPCRTQSCVRRSACPGRMGRSGWVRSRAWTCDFSSTHSTAAFSGGLR
jgi:hypothetical protein